MTKTLLKPAPDGSVTIPKELLGDAPPGTAFVLERDGRTLRLEPRACKLFEIEDPEERKGAVEGFMRRIAHKTGVSWPETYNVRGNIYD
jgi:PAS domain-containing protein